jgi:hypothetical protein
MEPIDESAKAAEAADRSLGLSAGWVSLFSSSLKNHVTRGSMFIAILSGAKEDADCTVCRSHS